MGSRVCMEQPVRQRIHLMDEIRGFSIIMMVIYHAAYDIVAIFGVDFPLFYHPVIRFLEPLFAGLFIFVSGMSSRLSRSNLKRGTICFGLGMLITLTTFIAMPEELIVFGILHLLGISMILFALLRPALDRIPVPVGFAVFFALGIVTLGFPYGYLGIKGLLSAALPGAWYTTSYLFPLGLIGSGFHSADYFSIVPWLFFFLSGSYAGIPLKEHKFPEVFYTLHSRFFAATGKHTLIIYMLHQPILYGLLSLVFALVPR